MALNDSWNIRSRSRACHETERPFVDGETVYGALFPAAEGEGYDRKDYCKEAWDELRAKEDWTPPYSYWSSKFELPVDPNAKSEVVAKESAEALLRRLIEDDEAASENARYILAIMLERKKILKQVDAKDGDESRMLIYEHASTAEAFIVRDPLLKLAEIDALQEEVAGWLGGGKKDEEETGESEPTEAAGEESPEARPDDEATKTDAEQPETETETGAENSVSQE